jgi:hypothetical protein
MCRGIQMATRANEDWTVAVGSGQLQFQHVPPVKLTTEPAA